METQIYPHSSPIGPNPPAIPRSPPRTSTPTDSTRPLAPDISPTKPAQALLAMANAQAPPMLAPLTPSHSVFGPPILAPLVPSQSFFGPPLLAPLTPSHSVFGPPLPTAEPPSNVSRQAPPSAPPPPPPLHYPKLNDSAPPKEVAPLLPPPPLPRPPPASMPKSASAHPGKDKPIRKKQRRYRAIPEQLERLIALFDENMSPSGHELITLSREINMPHQSVIWWFKNRRARTSAKKAAAAAAAAEAKARGAKPVTPS